MTPKPYREILDNAAGDRIPDDLNLLPGIAAQYQKQKGSSMKPQLKFALAALLSLAVITVLLFTVPAVATAMRRVLGYIPGLGLVEQGTVRVLADPVTTEREGVLFTVEKGSADAQRTILLLSVSGMTASDRPESLSCTGSPQLRLANGSILPVREGTGYGRDTGYTQRLVFEALPVGEKKVNLEVPCLMNAVPGKWPENWQIPLTFISADPSTLAPVIELQVPTATPALPVAEAQTEVVLATPTAPQVNLQESGQPGETKEPSPTDLPTYGIRMSLDKVAELQDGYVLMGNMSWTDAQVASYGVQYINPRLLDANGQPVYFEETPPDSFPEPGNKQSFWAIKVPGKEHAWPLTLSTAVQVTLALPVQPSFPLDLSSPPAPGQNKNLNLDFEVSGHTIHVLGYRVETDDAGNAILRFTMKSDPSVWAVSLFDIEHPVLGGGGGGSGSDTLGPFTGGFTYDGALPGGSVNITITSLMLYIDGRWQVTWQP